MKKIVLVFAVLFASMSGSFAYQQTLSAGPPENWNSMTVHINATCSYVKLDCFWYGFMSGDGNGSVQAYGDNGLIGEYTFMQGVNAPGYSSGIFNTLYWGSVQVYLSAFSCYGQATLAWGL